MSVMHGRQVTAPRSARCPPRVLELERWAGLLIAWVAALAALCAGTGWLYLLRHIGALDAGPRLDGALPLQQLNGDSAQPLARVLVAWLPAGLAAGGALAALTRLGAGARTAAVLGLAALVLAGSGALSDALALNEPLRSHVGDPFSRAGWWAELGCAALGALLVSARANSPQRAAHRLRR